MGITFIIVGLVAIATGVYLVVSDKKMKTEEQIFKAHRDCRKVSDAVVLARSLVLQALMHDCEADRDALPDCVAKTKHQFGFGITKDGDVFIANPDGSDYVSLIERAKTIVDNLQFDKILMS